MLSTFIDFIHALSMIVWVASMPFLFWHRWKTASIIAACYNLFFITVNRLGHWLLGECVLTRLARECGGTQDPEFFVVRVSREVFGYIPIDRNVVFFEQFLVFIISVGTLMTLWKHRKNLG